MQQHNNLNLGKSLDAFNEIELTESEKSTIIHSLKETKYWKELFKNKSKVDDAEGTAINPIDHQKAIPETELTKDEIDIAFLRLRQSKYADLKHAEYQKKILKEPVYKLQTLETLREKFLSEGYILDQYNEEKFEMIARYFLKDETGPLNLNKGLALGGNVGCGKTTIMKFFQFNQTQSYILKSVREIAGAYSKIGHDAIARYNDLIKFGDTHLSYGQTELGCCFDDLGTEEDRKHFGNESNVMADIILNRYDNYLLKAKTHITTNLSGDEVEQRYGTRVRSRFREMFNFVKFDPNAQDRRK